MNILVTGKNGQLGSEIQELSYNLQQFTFFFTDIGELDITNKSSVLSYFKENNIKLVINCAAYTAVDNAEDELDIADKVNNHAVNNLVRAAEINDAYIIHISTDYVFDGTNHSPYIESEITSPIGVYGQTKLDGEKHVINSSTRGVVIRTSWVYSKFGNNFVKTMMRLGKDRDELGVIADQVGTPTHAKDLAEVCLTLLSNQQLWSESNEIYHFSNDGVCSWYDFAFEIMRQNNISCTINPIGTEDYPTKAKRPSYSVLNKNKIKKQFNIKGKHWTVALEEMLSK
ncbi:dTDP-4-dehydrorhamnose reductase [Flammeovirga sp. EKP202]|uniref:dTDP-4-dehydrorhamnose reductase n=1 Tax=Flammeovirga sp. EKP202 TaxID=2770592 RepID=UPI00165FC448|nr:dTDP-4-dehydrorhamnose reductase [Flammeovirga sp. EKP202]MBD0404477.1 dTDP-4-dehydrorhamnose reductase [Flammeovirga sp. EKP202]